MKCRWPAPVAGSLLIGMVFLAGCESSLQSLDRPGETPTAAFYVGSDRCASCHRDLGAAHAQSGHRSMLNRSSSSLPPEYPFRDRVNFPLQSPPPGRSWDDVVYVLGGFGWKALFIGTGGNLLTGDAAQYHLATGEWVPYRTGETVPYDCARCHTTGYQSRGNQLGLPGVVGSWQEDGVGCEACHGPGSDHVESLSAEDIVIDRNATQCGTCHARNAGGPILAESPDADGDQFIRHYSQFDELRGRDEGGQQTGPHRFLNCVSCHDPHVSSHFQADAGGVVVDCEDCHASVRVNIPGGGAHTCVHCHMPFATRSATKESSTRADVRTHIFRVDAAVDAEMFYESGGSWRARPFLTLDFVCLQCHTGRDLDWAAQWAGAIHAGGAPALTERR